LTQRRHRFPAEIIQHAIWLYLRFTLSYRDVEELLAERGLDVSYETVRRWVLKFGPLIARKLRQGRPRPTARWHLDEMVIRIAGKRMYLWRAVDHEGEVLECGRRGNGQGVPFRDALALVAPKARKETDAHSGRGGEAMRHPTVAASPCAKLLAAPKRQPQVDFAGSPPDDGGTPP
jgi:DDE superfamily endonuclease